MSDKITIIDDASIITVTEEDGNQVVITEDNSKITISDSTYVGIMEAPVDGNIYGRKDAGWELLGDDDFIHNNLLELQGGTTDEYYHLTQSAYDFLYEQDQAVKTTSDVTFNNIYGTYGEFYEGMYIEGDVQLYTGNTYKDKQIATISPTSTTGAYLIAKNANDYTGNCNGIFELRWGVDQDAGYLRFSVSTTGDNYDMRVLTCSSDSCAINLIQLGILKDGYTGAPTKILYITLSAMLLTPSITYISGEGWELQNFTYYPALSIAYDYYYLSKTAGSYSNSTGDCYISEGENYYTSSIYTEGDLTTEGDLSVSGTTTTGNVLIPSTTQDTYIKFGNIGDGSLDTSWIMGENIDMGGSPNWFLIDRWNELYDYDIDNGEYPTFGISPDYDVYMAGNVYIGNDLSISGDVEAENSYQEHFWNYQGIGHFPETWRTIAQTTDVTLSGERYAYFELGWRGDRVEATPEEYVRHSGIVKFHVSAAENAKEGTGITILHKSEVTNQQPYLVYNSLVQKLRVLVKDDGINQKAYLEMYTGESDENNFDLYIRECRGWEILTEDDGTGSQRFPYSIGIPTGYSAVEVDLDTALTFKSTAGQFDVDRSANITTTGNISSVNGTFSGDITGSSIDVSGESEAGTFYAYSKTISRPNMFVGIGYDAGSSFTIDNYGNITTSGTIIATGTDLNIDDFYSNYLKGSTIFGDYVSGDLAYFDFIVGESGGIGVVKDYNAYDNYLYFTPNQISMVGTSDLNFNMNRDGSNYNVDLVENNLNFDYNGIEYLSLVPITKDTKNSLEITYGLYDDRIAPASISNDIFIGDVTFNRDVDFDTNINIIGSITSVDSIQLDLAAAETVTEGQIAWNEDDGTIDVGLPGGVIGQLFQETFFDAKNQTGSTILNGTPVMFSAPVGVSGKVEIQKAIADGTLSPEYTMGITTQDIANGEFGKVTWFGKVRGIDTTGTPYGETWADGDMIYVSPTTAGHLTNVEPNTPNRRILVATVLVAHSNGTLLLRPTWTPKLTELDDVNGTALTVSGQIPVWDNTNGYFDFTSNILTEYVPYSGANADVDLGSYDITATKGTFTEDATIDTTLVLSSGSITDTTGTISFGDENLTTTGNVGIGGVAKTSHDLSVYGSIIGGDAFAYTPSGTLDFTFGASNMNSRFLFGQSNSYYGGLVWNYNATGSLGYLSVGNMNGTNTKGINILQDGKVGIGNIAPTEALDVTGNIKGSSTLTVPTVAATDVDTTNVTATEVRLGTDATMKFNSTDGSIDFIIH